MAYDSIFRDVDAMDDGFYDDDDDATIVPPRSSHRKISKATPQNERWLGWQQYTFTNMVIF